MVRYPEVYVYGVLQLLLNLLSVRVADVAIVQGGGLAMCERSDEYIESRKFEMSVFVLYFSRSAFKSPSKTNVLFSILLHFNVDP